jgi:hypothetical protein
MNEIPNDIRSRDPLELWQRQAVEGTAPSLAQVREEARSFARTIHRRNRREYWAAALVILFFGWHAVGAERLWERGGLLLLVAGTIYVVVQLARRGSARMPPAEASCLDFHRAELERQRDLLRGIWSWYLLPLVPGLAVLLGGQVLAHPASAWRVGAYALFCALLFAGIGWLNRRAALELERRIEELEVSR